MEKSTMKYVQYIPGLAFFIIGIVMLVALSGTLRYIGLVFIIITISYFTVDLFSRNNEANKGPYKSRTREEISRHKHHRH